MPPVGFEPAAPASERPQTHVLDRAAIETGLPNLCMAENVLQLQEKFFDLTALN
jgi:hypothetical protein